MARRLNYNDVVLATPVSVPYERFSDRTAHYWIGRALRLLLEKSGFEKAAIDGLSVASFSLGSDSAVALTQHFGFCTRWLDHVPMGGASGVVSLRRAARAVQSGDADVVACVAGDTNPRDGFRDWFEISRGSRKTQFIPMVQRGRMAVLLFSQITTCASLVQLARTSARSVYRSGKMRFSIRMR